MRDIDPRLIEDLIVFAMFIITVFTVVLIWIFSRK